MAKASTRSEKAEAPKKKLSRKNLKKLLGIFRFILPYRAYFSVGLVALMLSSLTLLAFPYLAGKLIDAAQGKTTPWFNSVNQVTLIFVVILAFQGIFSFSRIFFFAQSSERALADIRNRIFNKYMHLPMAFYDKHRTGELLSRITTDVSLIQDIFSVTLGELVRQVVNLVVGIGIILFFFQEITLFMLAIFPLVIVLSIVFGRFIRNLSRKTQDELAGANTIAEEAITGISVVKAFVNEWFESNRYGSAMQRVVQVALRTATYRGMFATFLIFILLGAIVAVIWYGAQLVQEGTMTAGDLLSFVLFTTFIGGSIVGLSNIYGQLQKAVGASERILHILDEEEETESYRAKPEKISLQGAVSFRAVSFAYPSRPGMPVLQGLDMSIAPGEKVALVGHSGAGKSTIVQLLMGFYQPEKGEILLDQRRLQEYALHDLRLHLGIVPQEPLLFGGSIRDNIAYGNVSASDNEIMEAASQANALEFIERFPEGFDTVVGERGIKLSGGQRQRIAIARVILKNPAVLILDEATSSLDAASEQMVQQALENVMRNRTSIIIAHRLATIRKVDRIFVIDKGSIAEVGNHQELASKAGGIYRMLAEMQFTGDVI